MEVTKILSKYAGFEDAEEDLKALLKRKNQFNNAVFIIRKLCVAVSSAKSPYSKTQTKSFKDICKLSSQTIIRDKVGDVIGVDQKLTAAMYHIARAIMQAGDYESFAEIVCAFVSVLKCMPISSDTVQVGTLTQFSVLIHNSFKDSLERLSADKFDNLESELINFIEILLQFVYPLSKQNLYLVFILAKSIIAFYSKKFGLGKPVISLQGRIILRLKQFFTSEQNELLDQNMSKLFQSSMSATVVFFQTCTTMKDYECALRVLRDMIEILNRVFPQSSHENKVVLAFGKVLNPFLFSLKNLPLNGLSHSEICEAMKFLEEALAESTQDSKPAEWATFYVSSVLSLLNSYWISDFEKAKSVFSLPAIRAFEEMISKLVGILKKNNFAGTCVSSSGQECPLQTGAPRAFFLEHTLVCLTVRLFHCEAESQPLLMKVCEKSFLRSEELLQTAIAKKCVRSTEMTFHLCENMCYAAMNNPKSHVVSKRLLKKSWDLYLSVSKNTEDSFQSRKSVAKNIVLSLVDVLRKLGENSSACNTMAVAVAVAVAIAPSSPHQDVSYWMKHWSDLVVALPDENVSLLTLLRSNKELKDLIPEYNEKSLNWAELFVWEMEALGSYGVHKFSVLLKSWETRKGLKLSALQKIKSAAYFMRALAFCLDLTDAKKLISDFKTEKYHVLLKTISSRDRAVAVCALAELSYFLFFVTKRLHQATSKEFFAKARDFKPLPKVVLSTADVVCEHDACDMTPTFPNLTVSKEVPLLTLLDSALAYWDEALYKGLEVSLLSSREQENSAQYLAEAAMFCRLSGHYLKERKAWEICLRFGERMRDDQLMLRAISGLMDLSCCGIGWVQRGQAIAATLEKEPTAKDVVHLFKHSNVLQCFANEKEEEAVSRLKELLQVSQAYEKWSWYYIRSKFLMGRYLMDAAPAKRKVLLPEESGDPLGIMRFCFMQTKSLVETMTTKSSGTSSGENRRSVIDHYALFQLHFCICLGLGYAYLEMMLPREARCFLKYELPVTQKMGLSLRTAECLSLLGKVDSLVLKTEETTVKIEGIKQILEVNSSDKEEPTVEVPVYQDEDNGNLMRIPSRDGNQLGASPTLSIERFSMPDFLSHKSGCSCYHCSHVLLHKLWLDLFYIQASVCTFQFHVKHATNFFCSGIKLAEKCRFKHEKLLNGFAERASLLEDFHRTETTLRFKYADLLSLYNKDTEAWNVNKHVFASINRAQLKDNLLLTEVKEQKISLIDIANPKAFSLEPETQQKKREAASKNGTSTSDVTPDLGLLKRYGSTLTVKTPAPSQRQKEGSRTPLQTITPQSVVPIKGKGFVPPRAVPPVFIFSNSDEESSPVALKSDSKPKAVRSKPTTTTRKKAKPEPAAVKANVVEFSNKEDLIDPMSSDDIKFTFQRFATPCDQWKRIPQEASDTEDEILIVYHKTRAISKVTVGPKTDKSKPHTKKSARAVSDKTPSNSVPERAASSRKYFL